MNTITDTLETFTTAARILSQIAVLMLSSPVVWVVAGVVLYISVVSQLFSTIH